MTRKRRVKTRRIKRNRRTQQGGLFKWASRLWSRKQPVKTPPQAKPPPPNEQDMLKHIKWIKEGYTEPYTVVKDAKDYQHMDEYEIVDPKNHPIVIPAVYPENMYSLPIHCKDAKWCMLFGEELEQLVSYFNNFMLDMNQTKEQTAIALKKLPVNSMNGLVAEVQFTKHGVDAYALLKKSLDINSDSLWYEYLVGQIINPWCFIFPSFLLTFGLYRDVPIEKYTKNVSEPFIFEGSPVLSTQNISDSCQSINRHHLCLLTQFLHGSSSLYSNYDHPDILLMKYQIYYTLFHLGKLRFMHNDLHYQNVLVVTLPLPLKFVYEQKVGPPVIFYTDKWVKFIDYGRSKVSGLTNDEVERKRKDLHKLLTDSLVLPEKSPERVELERRLTSETFKKIKLQQIPIHKGVELLEESEPSDSSEYLDSLCSSPQCDDKRLLTEYVNKALVELPSFVAWMTRTQGSADNEDQLESKLSQHPYLKFVSYYLQKNTISYLNGIINGTKPIDEVVDTLIQNQFYWIDDPSPVLRRTCGNPIGFTTISTKIKTTGIGPIRNHDHNIFDKYSQHWTLEEIHESLKSSVTELSSNRSKPLNLYGTLVIKGPTMEPMVFTKA